MRRTTAALWAEQDRHPGDRHRLFRAVADAVDADTVLYPGSWCDIAASFVWPSVTYVDADRRAARFFADPDGVPEIIAADADAAINPEFRFLHADYTDPLPLEAASVAVRRPRVLPLHGVPARRGDAFGEPEPWRRGPGVDRPALRARQHHPLREGGYRCASEDLQSYLVPKTQVEDIAEMVQRTGRGIAYTRPACCTGRCAGSGSTGGRARCSDYQGGW